ncbi:MAG: TIGR03032 family protein [Bdellovibrionales bacterium]|nr:TIGR03032 family protein [Bdellovibrionales bacterium]
MVADSDKIEPVVGMIHSTNLPELFRSFGGALFVTTYQANRILLCTASKQEKISILMRTLPKPMGLALRQKRMAICCKNQIWFFSPVFGLGDIEGSGINHEFTFAPRSCHVTGDVAAHQAEFVGDDFYFVNTRFSCVCAVREDASFTPIWKPHFVSGIAPEDRCHLNGFCFEDSHLRYATALGESDEPEGWRDQKASGGVLIDVKAREVLARGLSMPHSPKLHNGKLYCLESGRGRLVSIDRVSGEVQEVARFPGFLRGLDFVDRFAFVGLCKLRGEKMFRGLPIEELHDQLKCAVFVVDLQTGQTVAFMEFTKGVEELFDVGFYQGAISPHMVGFEGELIDEVMSLPQEINA